MFQLNEQQKVSLDVVIYGIGIAISSQGGNKHMPFESYVKQLMEYQDKPELLEKDIQRFKKLIKSGTGIINPRGKNSKQ